MITLLQVGSLPHQMVQAGTLPIIDQQRMTTIGRDHQLYYVTTSNITTFNRSTSTGWEGDSYMTAKFQLFDLQFDKIGEFSIDQYYRDISLLQLSNNYALIRLYNSSNQLALYNFQGLQLWIYNVSTQFSDDYSYNMTNDTINLDSIHYVKDQAQIMIQQLNITTGTVIGTYKQALRVDYNDLGGSDYFLSASQFSAMLPVNDTSYQFYFAQEATLSSGFVDFTAYFAEFTPETQTLNTNRVKANTCGSATEIPEALTCDFSVDFASQQITTSWLLRNDYDNLRIMVVDAMGYTPVHFIVSSDFQPYSGYAYYTDQGVIMTNFMIKDSQKTQITVFKITSENQQLWNTTIDYSLSAVHLEVNNQVLSIIHYDQGQLSESTITVSMSPYTYISPKQSDTTAVPVLGWICAIIILPIFIEFRKSSNSE